MIALQNISNRGMPVPPILKLLTALRFFATGSFQLVCADLLQVSQPSVSQILKNVSAELAAKLPLWVKRPSTEEEFAAIRNSFYAMASFPGVVGCIDCTHIPIKSPGGDLAEVYRNRKGWFSMNVQVVVGPSMEIMDIVCRWQGSVHDARIFHNSRLKHRFEAGQMRGILLGDSGHPLLPYLFTPVLHPTTGPERRYNTSHIRTRSIVERTFGIWKRRFPCLSTKLRTKLSTSLKVILACAVLHNVAVRHHAPIPDQERVIPVVDVPVHVYRGHNGRGAAERAALIQRHFSEEG
ncbi:putative nuclease HARBI1 isoform X1 [Ischnura elegans]|uniref:putative nuclease HARBI1 isoform X1 n=1 Tax=Ischnura elegans TaxID=197161 RepID=UPI001ED89B75|nr:putative nuclease HARBI1 isoform X1 [Ischnura elegans]